MGENWRSYRRGYERRFASWLCPRLRRCLPKHWGHAVPVFVIHPNCYNFGDLTGPRFLLFSFLRYAQASE
jgi:hypothetical protein